jgi:hypothetical protein
LARTSQVVDGGRREFVMRYRLTFLAGLGAGFVIGTRAGRQQYDKMRAAAVEMLHKPAVQESANAVRMQATKIVKAAPKAVADAGRSTAHKASTRVSTTVTERRDRGRARRVAKRFRKDAARRDGGQGEPGPEVDGQLELSVTVTREKREHHGLSRLVPHVPHGFGRHHHNDHAHNGAAKAAPNGVSRDWLDDTGEADHMS